MGQSSSSPGSEGAASGVSLSKDLEADIIRDFQDKGLKEEWDKYKASVLVNRSYRAKTLASNLQQLQAQREQIQAARAPRLNELDQQIEMLNAQFNQAAEQLEHDTKRLGDQYKLKENASAELDSIPLPCLGPRAHLMDCQKKYSNDTRPCDAYVKTLQKCVNYEILKGNKAENN